MKLDKLTRKFIWGENDHDRKIHIISWNTIFQPKNQGGLGMKSASQLNIAFLMKGLWNLCTQKESLWVQVIREKYKCGEDNIPVMSLPKSRSNFWARMCKAWPDFFPNII
uniref:Ribonuclease H protein At1g65750 family n=1 Tax=Cajanus cajan TaxID=3821 RepID=A0A151TBC4_CAJCA|nr:Putative ribonuclease H protein At1g65750 family [Cajanus cajan]